LNVAKTENVKNMLRRVVFAIHEKQQHIIKLSPAVGSTVCGGRKQILKPLSLDAKRTKRIVRIEKKSKGSMLGKLKKTIVPGRRCKTVVYSGRCHRTNGGLRKEDLTINRRGRVVSLRKQARAKRTSFANIAGWLGAFKKARVDLGLSGFVLVKKGSILYERTKFFYESTKPS